MRKKVMLIILLGILFISRVNAIEADLYSNTTDSHDNTTDSYYKCTYSGDNVTVSFQLEPQQSEINTTNYSPSYITIMGRENDAPDKILNWYGVFGLSNFEPYKYFQENKKCPQKMFVFDRKRNIIDLLKYEKYNNIVLIDQEGFADLKNELERVSKNLSQLTLTKQETLSNDSFNIGECVYIRSKTDNEPKLTVTVDVEKLFENSDEKMQILMGTSKRLKVSNWNTSYSSNFDFIVKRFVETYKKCPNYAIYTESKLFLSNDETCDTLSSILNTSVCYTASYLGDANSVEEDYSSSPDGALSCYDYDENKCKTDDEKFSCVWVKGKNTPGYCNVDRLQYVKCGDAFDIPEQAPRIMSFVINLLKIGTPIILIITGIITLVKALAASKEDEMKKATSLLIKKVIASALVFFVVSIVQFVILKVADSSETGGVSSCLSCFLNNDCSSNVYFKTKVGDSYVCHLVSDPTTKIDCGENSTNNANNRVTDPNQSNRRISGQTQ